ncbi:MAG TPA: phosphoribosylformylglycinamidine cyclo-ligase [Candidatus Kapabacteria bacterium]|jgi:phosphoribosylformylglycinamidine cyclo-ligase
MTATEVPEKKRSLSYERAGVNIATGEEVVTTIKSMVQKTYTPRVLSDIGGFGGLFDARFPDMEFPVLVSSTDSVGTKVKIAIESRRNNTVGQDLVNHCVNDILVCGAKPLFFLDYFATGKLRTYVAEGIVAGLVKACEENGCALIGGETAEMPGIYSGEDYDLAGTIVGIAEKDRLFKQEYVAEGDLLIGLRSNGLHTNGYSLARHVLLSKYILDATPSILGGETIGDALLQIHRSYLKPIWTLLERFSPKNDIHALSHITGGGIIGNTSRVVPEGLTLDIDWNAWTPLPIFQFIQQTGHISDDEMRKAFNMGIGLILLVTPSRASEIEQALIELGEEPVRMGRIVKS